MSWLSNHHSFFWRMASRPRISAGISSLPTGSTLTMSGEYSEAIASRLRRSRHRATSSWATAAVEAGAAVAMVLTPVGVQDDCSTWDGDRQTLRSGRCRPVTLRHPRALPVEQRRHQRTQSEKHRARDPHSAFRPLRGRVRLPDPLPIERRERLGEGAVPHGVDPALLMIEHVRDVGAEVERERDAGLPGHHAAARVPPPVYDQPRPGEAEQERQRALEAAGRLARVGRRLDGGEQEGGKAKGENRRKAPDQDTPQASPPSRRQRLALPRVLRDARGAVGHPRGVDPVTDVPPRDGPTTVAGRAAEDLAHRQPLGGHRRAVGAAAREGERAQRAGELDAVGVRLEQAVERRAHRGRLAHGTATARRRPRSRHARPAAVPIPTHPSTRNRKWNRLRWRKVRLAPTSIASRGAADMYRTRTTAPGARAATEAWSTSSTASTESTWPAGTNRSCTIVYGTRSSSGRDQDVCDERLWVRRGLSVTSATPATRAPVSSPAGTRG